MKKYTIKPLDGWQEKSDTPHDGEWITYNGICQRFRIVSNLQDLSRKYYLYDTPLRLKGTEDYAFDSLKQAKQRANELHEKYVMQLLNEID